MGQKFDELKNKIDNADKSQVTDILQQVKQENEQGNINDDEKQTLIDKAKDKAGDIDLGKFKS